MALRRRVLVVGMQRSGTSVTHAVLAGHPQVAIARDEIHAAFFSCTPAGGGSAQAFADTFDFVAGARDDAKVLAIKTALPSPAYASRLAACLATHGSDIDLVIVRRRDLIAQLGSLRLAETTGTWHRRTRRVEASVAVAFAPGEVERYVAECFAVDLCIESVRSGRRVLDLDHDDHVATGAAWPMLFRFLGVDELAPDWLQMRKRSPRPAEYIADYDAWSAALPELLRAARAAAVVPAAHDVAPSRVYLLHRAQMHLRAARPAAALDDAIASLSAPADWGTETLAWACDTIGHALDVLGDATRAPAILELLETAHRDDADARTLAGRIRAALG